MKGISVPRIEDILTTWEIERAKKIRATHADRTQFQAALCEELIVPNLPRIYQRLQDCNPPERLAAVVDHYLDGVSRGH